MLYLFLVFFNFSLLIGNNLTKSLMYIDLSGCIDLTSDCISKLIFSSKSLNTENLYLCDNIQSLSTVNCCRNSENNSGRYCCRSTD